MQRSCAELKDCSIWLGNLTAGAISFVLLGRWAERNYSASAIRDACHRFAVRLRILRASRSETRRSACCFSTRLIAEISNVALH
jgi:hypothetical protein